jgi:hypothetical protein
MLCAVILAIIYADFYNRFHYAFVILLSIILLGVILLNLVLLSILMHSVIILSIIMLSVVMLSVVAPFEMPLFVFLCLQGNLFFKALKESQ